MSHLPKAGDALMCARRQPVSVRAVQVRGYAVQVRIGSAGALVLDLETAEALRDALAGFLDVAAAEQSTPTPGGIS